MKKINQTLFELIIGILISGFLIWLVSLLITGFDAAFAASYAAGVATAVLLSFHMYRSIDRALDMDPGDAEKYMRKAYIFRTFMILVAAGIVCWIDQEDIIAVFLGILCLKFGAFLQPLTSRLLKKRKK